jgi:hypothetical protein
MLRRSWSGAAGAVIITLAVPHLAAAQAPGSSPATAAAPTTSLAPTLAATHISFSSVDHASLMANANTSAARMSPSEGKAVAIVGAAVVVIGLVVGGDTGTVIAIGGAGLGLFGIYIWQRGD